MKKYFIFLSLILCFFFLSSAFAKMNVLTIERSPFVFYENDKLTGFSIDLLKEIKKRSGIQYSLQVETSFSDMLEKIKDKKADAAIANISITAEREKMMDFSYPIFDSGIQMLERKPSSSFFASSQAKRVFLIFFILLLLSGGVSFLKKRTHILENIPSAAYLLFFWVLGGGWMVILSLNQLAPHVQAKGDRDPLIYLKGKTVGTSQGTTMSRFLEENNIAYTHYNDYQEALKALESGEVSVILADAAVAKYYASHEGKEKVQLVGDTFERDELGIAFKTRYNLRKKINQILLQIKEDGTYEKLMLKYFGEEY